jgi:hypothetical protein
MRQAALAGRAGEALLNRTDEAGRPVADHEQRIAEPSGAQVLKERSHRLDVLSRTGHQSKPRFAAILADPPGGQHSLPPLTRPQTLGDAVDEQVGDGMLGEIALAEVFYSAQSFSVISLTASGCASWRRSFTSSEVATRAVSLAPSFAGLQELLQPAVVH